MSVSASCTNVTPGSSATADICYKQAHTRAPRSCLRDSDATLDLPLKQRSCPLSPWPAAARTPSASTDQDSERGGGREPRKVALSGRHVIVWGRRRSGTAHRRSEEEDRMVGRRAGDHAGERHARRSARTWSHAQSQAGGHGVSTACASWQEPTPLGRTSARHGNSGPRLPQARAPEAGTEGVLLSGLQPRVPHRRRRAPGRERRLTGRRRPCQPHRRASAAPRAPP
mmetsp:Transcript_1781/g.5780  ORF Transcript_1781/g.5780 Transcript_1781/m.5780 type:complete len:227 (+) Transcript_1781:141-821(+)